MLQRFLYLETRFGDAHYFPKGRHCYVKRRICHPRPKSRVHICAEVAPDSIGRHYVTSKAYLIIFFVEFIRCVPVSVRDVTIPRPLRHRNWWSIRPCWWFSQTARLGVRDINSRIWDEQLLTCSPECWRWSRRTILFGWLDRGSSPNSHLHSLARAFPRQPSWARTVTITHSVCGDFIRELKNKTIITITPITCASAECSKGTESVSLDDWNWGRSWELEQVNKATLNAETIILENDMFQSIFMSCCCRPDYHLILFQDKGFSASVTVYRDFNAAGTNIEVGAVTNRSTCWVAPCLAFVLKYEYMRENMYTSNLSLSHSSSSFQIKTVFLLLLIISLCKCWRLKHVGILRKLVRNKRVCFLNAGTLFLVYIEIIYVCVYLI